MGAVTFGGVNPPSPQSGRAWVPVIDQRESGTLGGGHLLPQSSVALGLTTLNSKMSIFAAFSTVFPLSFKKNETRNHTNKTHARTVRSVECWR